MWYHRDKVGQTVQLFNVSNKYIINEVQFASPCHRTRNSVRSYFCAVLDDSRLVHVIKMQMTSV